MSGEENARMQMPSPQEVAMLRELVAVILEPLIAPLWEIANTLARIEAKTRAL